MDLQVKLNKNTVFFIIRRDLLTLGKHSYLVIVSTKRKVGAHIAMSIKGNVHLLFHYA
jgi:hypothetical protein